MEATQVIQDLAIAKYRSDGVLVSDETEKFFSTLNTKSEAELDELISKSVLTVAAAQLQLKISHIVHPERALVRVLRPAIVAMRRQSKNVKSAAVDYSASQFLDETFDEETVSIA